MTSSMGQKRWKDSWSESGRRHSGIDCTVATKPPAGSEVSSMTDYSLERSATRDTTFLLRDQSTVSSHLDTTNYQDKLQGWSAVFPDGTILAPRPGTSLNPTRPPVDTKQDMEREISFLRANRSVAFPAKPRELFDPLDGFVPSPKNVSQRKYYVLPSIGSPSDLVLRRQHSNVETLNQLDYTRDNYEDDAQFFAELVELKRERRKSDTPLPQCITVNPLPPIQKLKDVVRPRTYIAEQDEERLASSCRSSPSSMSILSDVEEFRGKTPDPDYADTSPRKVSCSSEISPRKVSCASQMKPPDSTRIARSQTFILSGRESREESTPASAEQESANG